MDIKNLIDSIKNSYDPLQFDEKWIEQKAEGCDIETIYKMASEYCGVIDDETFGEWCEKCRK